MDGRFAIRKPTTHANTKTLARRPTRIAFDRLSRAAEQWIGFSTDEIGRVSDHKRVAYIGKRYPLIELGMSRNDCERWLRSRGWTQVAKSACIGCLMRNCRTLVCPFMTVIEWARYPLLADHEHGRRWLQFTANIGRAPNTIDAYGRAAEDHLRYCHREGFDPLTTKADAVAGWIGDLRERPNPRSAKVIHLDSGAGLANATRLGGGFTGCGTTTRLLLIHAGASVKTVQLALGHSNPTITLNTYVHEWPEAVDRTGP